MKTNTTDILIIGAGLTGLTLAYYLKQLNVSATIVEARSHIGGRISTTYNPNQAPVDLGATWLMDSHNELKHLLQKLDLSVFKQHYGNTAIYEPNSSTPAQLVNLPESNAPSYRITHGTQTLIKTLSNTVESDQIITNCAISSIKKTEEFMYATSKTHSFKCKYIVSTLPPHLFNKTISIRPKLPDNITTICQNTHTWMHDSIKVGFTFTFPFWKTKGTSGTIYSSVGALQEFYDHSNAEQNKYALVGFMNKTFYNYTKAERQEFALKQLQAYYGSQVRQFLSYEELIWQDEVFTNAHDGKFIMQQQNNGHPLFQNPLLNNSLFIAGTETSPFAPGKMEGAIRSAQFIFKQIASLL
jgi:monoamine oxidase